jgi:hypothetical protein
VLNPSISLDEEPAYGGKSCAAPIPIEPWKGDANDFQIFQTTCNNKGTLCPFGESYLDPVGSIYKKECFNGDIKLTGCQGCDQGSGGPACTCSTPVNLALDVNPASNFDSTYLYLDLGTRYFVSVVNISTCDVSEVVLSNEFNSDEISVDCTFNGTTGLFDCPNNIAYRYILYYPVTTIDSLQTCIVSAYTDFFQYCGQNDTVNNFAARFYVDPAYRDGRRFLYDEIKQGVANFGCTITSCFCGPNNGGEQCKAYVSAIRTTDIDVNSARVQTTLAKRFCGEEVSVPKLDNLVEGRGQIDPVFKNCSCNEISNVDNTGQTGRTTERFVGNACECMEVYNKDRDANLVCAGNGVCEPVDIPFGRCEKDLSEYLTDALSEPFAVVTSFTELNSRQQVVADSFFVGDTIFPTSTPTTSPSFTINPTPGPTDASGSIVFFTDDNYYATTDLSDLGVVTNICNSSKPTGAPTELTCDAGRVFPMLNYNTSFMIANLHERYSFSTEIPIYNDAGLQLASSWAQSINPTLSPTPRLLTFMANLPIDDNFWTGSGADGTMGVNCISWTSNSVGDLGIDGDRLSLNFWLNGDFPTCDNTRKLICGCVSGNTLLPTTSPTNAPSTSPTVSPNNIPTVAPTQAPNRVMYRLVDGSVVELQRIRETVKYDSTQTGINSPNTPISLQLLEGAALQPIWWENVVMREYNITLGTTVTRTVGRCNPADQAIPPGQYVFEGPCPYLDHCVLTDDCTDDLSPASTFMGFLTDWPDLRGCVCSKDITERTDTAVINDNERVFNLEVVSMETETLEPNTDIDIALGDIDCNNFIDRTINCALSATLPGYTLRCRDEPIGCFDGPIGFAFGGFDQNHPVTKYNIPRELWGENQWKGKKIYLILTRQI